MTSRRAAFLTSTALSAAPRPLKRATGLMAGVALTGLLHATPTFAQVTVTGDVNPNPPQPGAITFIGQTAVGAVTVEGGSGVVDQGTRIGVGSQGTVTVRGAGSTWTTTNGRAFSVGYFTRGELLIENGGRVVAPYSFIGNYNNSVGVATVQGDGSTWHSGFNLSVGSGGTGTLTIRDRGTVTNGGSVFIGENLRGTGTAVVSGDGSVWRSDGSVFVGNLGTGTLTIVDNARVTSGDAIFFGFEEDSHGTGTVRDAGSTLTTTAGLSVGFRGTGSLTIEDGATVESERGFIGTDPTGNGTVTVAGAGSTWSSSSFLRVGHTGSGALTIEESGLVATDQATVGLAGGNGTLNLDGTAGARGILETGQVVGGASTGTLNLNGGTLRATADHAEFLSGFDAVNVANRGAYIDTNGHNIGATSLLEGTGSLTKRGAGRLTLTGNNSYGGGTTIAGGTLQLGDGGASGSIVGNVINNGTLAFNRSNTLTFDGDISGNGEVQQIGAGDTVLTGSNSYAGATTVIAGGLFVNGDQSAATGATAVAGGATLGGTGTIGGSVTVADSGVLNPGGRGNAPGTLTIAGNLDLAPNAVLNYRFGEAGVPGGALNDLTNVGGDLVLDGTLNITTSAGGSFDPGIYRVINYEGNLTANNGLELGTPTPDLSVQLAPGQVNLINTAGLTFRYWDGASGGKGDGIIDGGNGSWQNFTGNDDYWTDVTGTPNGAFTDKAFAVFMGDTGTVTVDDGLGAINVSGMQFLTDGYVITGNAINLVGTPTSVINVGDGSGAAETTATILSDLNGTTQLVKTNSGTLILSGNNGYTGGTAIKDGTLQVAADTNLGAASGDLTFSGGTLLTTADMTTSRDVTFNGAGTFDTDTGTTLTLDGAISGAGALTKDGAGSLLLLSNSGHDGGTTIADGILQLGNGGATGGLQGDIVNDGLLVVDRSNSLTLDGDISGTGAFTQGGTGTTILSGLNSYSGATTISAGTLLVNGDQSAATGATTTAAGTTLGGAGVIGGDVSVADGAVLEPGSTVGGVGTLTINGNLALADGSALNMQFGEANVAGGLFNDLVDVGGDLALDGTLNVSVSLGGTFGAGIYRVINYGGQLTDGGLAFGTMPADSDVFLQTSVANQINLVNRNGLVLNYWDGDAGPKFNKAIDGGNGSWQNSLGNDNWTDAGGAINAAYADGSYAIFTGVSGTVTVDDSLGAINASGMQFAVDGYRIEGDVLNLVGPRSVIRVGDGTTDGAEMTATIASELAGTGELVKSDLGTLILEDDNSYSGGTSMTGGTLQVAADGALGDAAGGLSFDGGTLRTTADITTDRSVTFDGEGAFETVDGTMLTLDGSITGPGIMNKDGAGTLLVTGDNSGYLANSKVAAGTLAVDGVLGGNVDVASLGRLEGNGSVGGIINAGVVAPGRSIGTLTVTGDYVGSDGTLEIETTLGDDSSPTDLLAVNGDTSGSTTVTVTNRGGIGGQTVEGIKIIDVGGASNGTFTLDGDYVFEGEQAVVAGAYGYRLYKNGITDPADGDWYLRSALLDPQDPDEPDTPIFQPGVPIYESYAGTLQQFNKLGTLQQRVGNRLWAAPADGASGSDAGQKQPLDSSGVWARIEAAHAEFEPDVSTSGANYDASTWKFQGGVDGLLVNNEAGYLIGGVFAQYGTISSSISSPFGTGSIDTTGYGLGATLTWYGDNGFYADGQAQVTWYDSDLHSDTAGRSLVTGNDGMGYGLSIEAGKRIAISENWSLTPQAQLAYSSVEFDDFTDAFGADVSLDKSRSLVSRLGVAVNHDTEWRARDGSISRAHLYGIANLYYDFAGKSKVEVAEAAFESRNDRLFGGIGFGGSFNWDDDKYSLYGEGQLNTSLENFGDSNAVSGTIGFRVRW